MPLEDGFWFVLCSLAITCEGSEDDGHARGKGRRLSGGRALRGRVFPLGLPHAPLSRTAIEGCGQRSFGRTIARQGFRRRNPQRLLRRLQGISRASWGRERDREASRFASQTRNQTPEQIRSQRLVDRIWEEGGWLCCCLLYTSDAADDLLCVDL